MSAIKKSTATLRIFGDDLDPQNITQMLGAPPTQGWFKGEKGKHIAGPKAGDVRIAKTGMWRLEALDREPANIDAQIWEIFNQVTTDLTVWQAITEKYCVDLFCGLFMNKSNDSLEISPHSLAALGERGIQICFDIYAPIGDD
jgi:hypothetical protein